MGWENKKGKIGDGISISTECSTLKLLLRELEEYELFLSDF